MRKFDNRDFLPGFRGLHAGTWPAKSERAYLVHVLYVLYSGWHTTPPFPSSHYCAALPLFKQREGLSPPRAGLCPLQVQREGFARAQEGIMRGDRRTI